MERELNNHKFKGEREIEIITKKEKKYIDICEEDGKSKLELVAEKLNSNDISVIYDKFNLFHIRTSSKTENNRIMRTEIRRFNRIVRELREFRNQGIQLDNPSICIIKKEKFISRFRIGIVKNINEPLTEGQHNLILMSYIMELPCDIYCIGKKSEDKSNVEVCKRKFNLTYPDYWKEYYKMKFGEKSMEGADIRGSLCKTCGYPTVMSYLYDASLCLNCNVWFEKNCGDPDCMFCGDRPEPPR